MPRILSDKKHPSNGKPQLGISGLLFALVASAGMGAQSDAAHGQSSLPSSAPTSQASKKVLPNDPVGKLFNDGPRVAYTQDPGADPIEQLFWDRELKKEKLKALRETQDPIVEKTEPETPRQMTEDSSGSKAIEKQSSTDEAASPVKHDDDSAQKQSTILQPSKKETVRGRSANDDSPKPLRAKEPAQPEAPRVSHQPMQQAADVGVVNGVGINSAVWPVSAKPKNAYGKKGPEGRPWQGLVFDVPTGTPVRAIDSGRVMYANDFKNYGNLIIVDHGDRVASVYASNQKLLVKEGAQVGTGDVIALSGQTGSLNYPALYFEIRKEGKPVDPMQFLKRR